MLTSIRKGVETNLQIEGLQFTPSELPNCSATQHICTLQVTNDSAT